MVSRHGLLIGFGFALVGAPGFAQTPQSPPATAVPNLRRCGVVRSEVVRRAGRSGAVVVGAVAVTVMWPLLLPRMNGRWPAGS